MSLETKTHVASSMSVSFADSSAFNNVSARKLFNLDQITEESLSNRFEISGLVTDQVVDLGNINSPSLVVIKVTSLYDGGGSTTEDNPAPVKFKVGSGTIFDCHFMAFFVDVDANAGEVTKDIKITTVADSNTTVEVFVAGAKT